MPSKGKAGLTRHTSLKPKTEGLVLDMATRNLKRIQQKNLHPYNSCVSIPYHTEILINTLSSKICVGSCPSCWQYSRRAPCLQGVIWILTDLTDVLFSEYTGRMTRACSHLALKGTGLWSETWESRIECSSTQVLSAQCSPGPQMVCLELGTGLGDGVGWGGGGSFCSFTATIFRIFRNLRSTEYFWWWPQVNYYDRLEGIPSELQGWPKGEE